MNTKVEQRVVAQLRREYLLVDRPMLSNVTATVAELSGYCSVFNLTMREAKIMWLLRGYLPVDLSLIPAARTHIYAMRKKIKLAGHNLEIKSLWRGVYQLSIVGD